MSTVWVCVDCLYAHEGIDNDSDTVGGGEPLSLLPVGVPVTSGTLEHADDCPNIAPDGSWLGITDEPCETREFTWAFCEGCGSPLGGSRHALTVWDES